MQTVLNRTLISTTIEGNLPDNALVNFYEKNKDDGCGMNEYRKWMGQPWRMVWKAVSTLVEWSADVSMNESEKRTAKFFASSVVTFRK